MVHGAHCWNQSRAVEAVSQTDLGKISNELLLCLISLLCNMTGLLAAKFNLTGVDYKSSVESQKGVNNVQRCSTENHKGAIAVQSLWR